MKIAAISLLFLSAVNASQVTPVQKVIQLMEGMLAKGKADNGTRAEASQGEARVMVRIRVGV